MKFLEQENERMNREIVRWKERLDGIEKDKHMKIKEIEDEKNFIVNAFEEYKLSHNEEISIEARADVEEAIKKV